MGNITNLATTGNYATEAEGLKVEFSFVIDNEKKMLKQFNGSVREVIENEDERPIERMALATFSKNEGHVEVRDGISMTLTRGREVELATAIVNAVAAFEAKIVKGEAVNTVVE
mgnify:CR=1 FL=1